MRKFTAIILVALYACSSTEAYQLLKMPALVVHYLQHSREDPEMSFLNFLHMHYAEAQVMDADWQQDMQLPFKSCESGLSHVAAGHYPPLLHLSLVALSLPEGVLYASAYGSFTPGLYCADIFEPPRMA
jgi:hypothetical protein